MELFEEKRLKHKISNGVLTISVPGIIEMKQNKSGDDEQTSHDVLLQFESEKEKVPVNKKLLKERIPYFNGMFSNCFQESNQSVVNLGASVDINSASKMIQLISKGSLKVFGEDIQGIFVLADLWGMDGVKNVCASFMISEMDSSNCIALFQLGEMHSCNKLKADCKLLISQEFQLICQSQAFLELSGDLLVSILQLESLNTGSQGEDCVMNAVLRWYSHNKADRETSVMDMMKHVYVHCISQQVLKTVMSCLPEAVVNDITSRIKSGIVSNKRQYHQQLMVFCGYSQSRTGPTCPLVKSVEMLDLDKSEHPVIPFPDAPAYGAALNLYGRIVFFATYVLAAEVSSKKSYASKVFSFRAHDNNGPWILTPELFSEKAVECISNCLVKNGNVVHCPEKNCIYAIEISRSVCIQVNCTDGNIFCDYVRDIPLYSDVIKQVDILLICVYGKWFQQFLFVTEGVGKFVSIPLKV